MLEPACAGVRANDRVEIVDNGGVSLRSLDVINDEIQVLTADGMTDCPFCIFAGVGRCLIKGSSPHVYYVVYRCLFSSAAAPVPVLAFSPFIALVIRTELRV